MKLLSITSATAFVLYLILDQSSALPGGKKFKRPLLAESGKAIASWYDQRSFPGETIDMSFITEGYQMMMRNESRSSSLFSGTWESIGPMNFGGRTLSLCFNPQNVNTLYAGSASGGLWVSYSAGTGASAWQEVETGFPVLGIASICINPSDSNEIYIGTGEVYNYQNTGTGVAVRTTRGTYGIGILKSVDGGLTWMKSLDWEYDELKGVQDLVMNPLRPQTVFAATTEGTYHSYDAGLTWNQVHSTLMATDLLMVPGDTSVIFIAAGNSFSTNAGIYRSTDGGSTFAQINSGLPADWSGKAMMDVSQSDPQIMFASIADQLTGKGLYKSINGGLNWFQVNPTDYPTYQGWYSHDVAVNPVDPQVVMCAGINMWKSVDGGSTLNEKSYWYLWDFDAITVGGPEGPPDYVHADIHRILYHPVNSDILYMATDGGVFRSLDNGETFEGCNGGYHTQQFYANFSCSVSDSLFAIGGMQDNATAVYDGFPGWRRVIGGDGVSTAINPSDDDIVYGTSQYLNLRRSDDHAQSFYGVSVPNGNGASNTCFAGPFALSNSNNSILYGGRTKVYKSVDGANNWSVTNGNNELDGNPVLVIEIADSDPDIVYAATAPVNLSQTGLFKTNNGGTSWTNIMTGIPNRYIMDIETDPADPDRVFVALSGFGTSHLFRSLNGGANWSSASTGIPDVPANSISIDPLNSDIIYLGNDLGIYVSIDGGLNFQPFNDGLSGATLIMDISISHSNRKLRLATHGKGIYERDMLPVTITGIADAEIPDFDVYPIPANNILNVSHDSNNELQINIYNCEGRLFKKLLITRRNEIISVNNWPPGLYFAAIDGSGNDVKKILVY